MNVPLSSSYFTDTSGTLTPSLFEGTLTVVPEPATWGLLSAIACGVLAVAKRGLRKRPRD